MQNQNTISSTGSALMGAGLVSIQNDAMLGLSLISIGAVLTIVVAYLQKKGLSVESNLG